MPAGRLRERVTFQARKTFNDGAGNRQGVWEDQFTVAAGLQALRGGEGVQAARLASRQPFIVTVRQSDDTRRATADWRLVDARRPGRVFNIRTITDPDGARAWFDLLVEEGVAT